MPKIRKVIDKSDSQVIRVGEFLPNIRFFGLLSGKTGSSKTTNAVNILANPEFGYSKHFKGEHMYIFSGSLRSDKKLEKLIEFYDVAESNLYEGYDNDVVHSLYDELEKEYIKREELDMPHIRPLLFFDDLSFVLGRGKEFNALTRLAQNSRKLGISVLITTQHYTQIPLAVRNNVSFAILYNSSVKNIEQFESEHNYLENKKMFMKMFRDNVKSKHDFLAVVYDNDNEKIYLDKDYEPIF